MASYKIEGPICFMTCGPGLEPVFELYEFLPDGRVKYIIKERPKYSEDTA